MTALPMALGKTPRAWQNEAFEAIRDGLRRWDSVLVDAATGAGKGDVIAGLCAAMAPHGRVLVIVGAEQLVDDLAARTRLLGANVGVYKGKVKELGHAVTVATVQAAIKAAPGVLEPVRYLIIDEAHHAPAPGYKKLRERLGARFTVGFTATPFRMDGGFETGLGSAFKATVYEYPIVRAVEEGVLAPFEVRRLFTGMTLQEADLQGDAEVERAVNTQARNELVVDRWMADGGGAGCWAFAAGVAHAEALADVMRSRGLNAKAVHGAKSPKADLEAFNARRLDVLVSAAKLTEGVDGQVFGALIAAPVLSLIRYKQIIGRALRNGSWRGGVGATIWEAADTCEGFAEVASMQALRGVEMDVVAVGVLRPGDRVEHRRDAGLRDGNVLEVRGEVITVAWLGVGAQDHPRIDLRRARPVMLDGVELHPVTAGRLDSGAVFTLVRAAEAPALDWYRYADSSGGIRLTAMLDIGAGHSKAVQVLKEGPGAWMALTRGSNGTTGRHEEPTIIARRVELLDALRAAEAWAARTSLRPVDLSKPWAGRRASERQCEALGKWGLKRFARKDLTVGEASLLISTMALRAAAREVT